ncbi:hypothetical protein [Brevibacillus brevis]|uniref:Uncharacterized protein n=1 Tax=Brevibacillus brevis TaxID=1393 RepID=A0ABY9T7T2_BREBE|nr:hypothetical protein [Brevibacillus brevis]WNC16163.1 hypothetical protein RGB73_07545 [Brevibacillus brevis]
MHRYAFKLITENYASRFGKGELLKAAVVEVQNSKLAKAAQFAKQ